MTKCILLELNSFFELYQHRQHSTPICVVVQCHLSFIQRSTILQLLWENRCKHRCRIGLQTVTDQDFLRGRQPSRGNVNIQIYQFSQKMHEIGSVNDKK